MTAIIDLRKNEIKKIVENCKHDRQSIIDEVNKYIESYQKYGYGGGEPFVIDELSVPVTLDKHYDEDGEVIDDDWMTTVTVNINDNEVDVDYD